MEPRGNTCDWLLTKAGSVKYQYKDDTTKRRVRSLCPTKGELKPTLRLLWTPIKTARPPDVACMQRRPVG